LAAFDGVGEDFVGSLNALEETVVFVGLPSGSFLIRMVTQDLLAVSSLNLLISGFVSVFRKAEDGVVVLSLRLLLAYY
jgi:hypothetical protein